MQKRKNVSKRERTEKSLAQILHRSSTGEFGKSTGRGGAGSGQSRGLSADGAFLVGRGVMEKGDQFPGCEEKGAIVYHAAKSASQGSSTRGETQREKTEILIHARSACAEEPRKKERTKEKRVQGRYSNEGEIISGLSIASFG